MYIGDEKVPGYAVGRGGKNCNQNGGLGSNLIAGSKPSLIEVFTCSRAYADIKGARELEINLLTAHADRTLLKRTRTSEPVASTHTGRPAIVPDNRPTTISLGLFLDLACES